MTLFYNLNLPAYYGAITATLTDHQSQLSEQSDAVVLIISEETGSISVAIDGMLKRHLAPQTLERLLRMELLKDETDKLEPKLLTTMKKVILTGKEEKRDDKK